MAKPKNDIPFLKCALKKGMNTTAHPIFILYAINILSAIYRYSAFVATLSLSSRNSVHRLLASGKRELKILLVESKSGCIFSIPPLLKKRNRITISTSVRRNKS